MAVFLGLLVGVEGFQISVVKDIVVHGRGRAALEEVRRSLEPYGVCVSRE